MSQHSEESQYPRRKNLTLGLALILIGGAFLFDRMALLDIDQLWQYWPALIALSGLIKIVSAKKMAHALQGALEIVIAFWLYASIQHLWGWSFHNSWPILLIAIGIGTIAGGYCHAENTEK